MEQRVSHQNGGERVCAAPRTKQSATISHHPLITRTKMVAMEEKIEIVNELNKIQWNEEDLAKLDPFYTECEPHVALERADLNEDWETFRYVLAKNEELMKKYLLLCKSAFDLNVQFDADNNFVYPPPKSPLEIPEGDSQKVYLTR